VKLVEDFLNGDELDDAPGLLMEGGALPLGIGAVVEGDEEAAPANSIACRGLSLDHHGSSWPRTNGSFKLRRVE
jgi:hypothetical protein